ncbi:lysoplasmalogenase family protein [Tenacibaculum holothuriorum]|nr:lysoplasmalogenase family protein [Tenacibaculum holothuriorum]
MILKIGALLSLSFLYLDQAKKINNWYLIILLSSIASDAFLIFDSNFLLIGSLLLLLNRILYIVITRRALFDTKTGTLLIYFIPCLLLFFIIYALLKPYVEQINISFILLGITSAVAILFSFLNYLNRMNKQNLFFLFGILLIVFSDVLSAYNKFLDYHLYYVIIYTVMFYLARYLICRSMILQKK